MSRLRLVVWPLVAIAIAFVIWKQNRNADAPAIGTPPGAESVVDELGYSVGDFKLTDQEGHTVTKKDLDGKIWVASFFFSSCPGPCLALNQQIAELAREYGPRGVVFVSITVDPENDSPAVLKEYARRFEIPADQWRFLTGDYAVVEDLAVNSFKVGVGERTGDGPPGAYDISHSDRLMIVDRTGKVRAAHRGREVVEVNLVKKKLTRLLKEPS